jgi:hypothetical protein
LARAFEELLRDAKDAEDRELLRRARDAFGRLGEELAALGALPRELQLLLLERFAPDVAGPARDAIAASSEGRLWQDAVAPRSDAARSARRELESVRFYGVLPASAHESRLRVPYAFPLAQRCEGGDAWSKSSWAR